MGTPLSHHAVPGATYGMSASDAAGNHKVYFLRQT